MKNTNKKKKLVVLNRFDKKIELRKIYEKGERFYGQVLVRNIEMTSGYRIPMKEWLKYVENHIETNFVTNSIDTFSRFDKPNN